MARKASDPKRASAIALFWRSGWSCGDAVRRIGRACLSGMPEGIVEFDAKGTLRLVAR
jgi:hypothetical protein